MQITLPAEAGSPRRARAFAADALRAGGLCELCETGVLLVSELATNAVQHAHTEFDVDVCCRPGGMRVEVRDSGGGQLPGWPPQLDPGLPEGGRGLALLQALATRWGVICNGADNLVWFEGDLRPDITAR